MKESCSNAIESLKKIKDESKSAFGAEFIIKEPYNAQKKKEIKAKYEKYKKEMGNEIIPYKIDSDKKKDTYGYKDIQKLVRLMTPRKSSRKAGT
jgi:hypothetical protein